MNEEEKSLLRRVVKKVHPDLYSSFPTESQRNSESLKLLNAYLDNIRDSQSPQETRLEFWTGGGPGEHLRLVRAELPNWGSLGPLFYAFDLIDEDQLLAGVGRCKKGVESNILSWLGDSIGDAAKAADDHDTLRRQVRELRAEIEDAFDLAAIQLGGEYSVSNKELHCHLEALQILKTCLESLGANDLDKYKGLSFYLRHPDSEVIDPASSLRPDGSHDLFGASRQSFVGDDGTLHVTANRGTVQAALQSLDLGQARLLTQVAGFWTRRSRDLTNALVSLLGVERIWCDARTEQANQKFVLWAGKLIAARKLVVGTLQGKRFNYSMLVHCDAAAPIVEFSPSSSVLQKGRKMQVRTDASPETLLQFLAGSLGSAAEAAAAGSAAARREEEAILEKAREVLGLKHVIRVCPSSEHSKVIQAAQRLVDNAEAIRKAGISLAGASLAIDDCYEVWESGFISIPHDFHVHDLQPKLRKLLGPSSTLSSDADSSDAEADPSLASEDFDCSERVAASDATSIYPDGMHKMLTKEALVWQDERQNGIKSPAAPKGSTSWPSQQVKTFAVAACPQDCQHMTLKRGSHERSKAHFIQRSKQIRRPALFQERLSFRQTCFAST